MSVEGGREGGVGNPTSLPNQKKLLDKQTKEGETGTNKC